MTTTVNLRRLLDRKAPEFCTPAPLASAAATTIAASTLGDNLAVAVISTTAAYLYDAEEDGWTTLPSPAMGAWAAGACGCFHPAGPRAFPTAGTTTTITTNLTLARSLVGYKIRIIAGPNAGEERTIASNTVGANAVITVSAAYGAAITTASEFILLTGRYWFLGSGAAGANSFKYFDYATATWTAAAFSGLPTVGTDGRLIATANLTPFVTGTATGGSSSTLVNAGKSWATNQWANYQVRITAGTGAGQFRAIASNTGTTLTVATNWTTAPDATSVYAIEGNWDAIYYGGNAAVTLYRYSISGNTWATITPGVARAAAPNSGGLFHWASKVSDATWNIESAFFNGRYLYSFRGNGSAVLDRYDIAANTWENGLVYHSASELIAAASCATYLGDDIIIALGNTGRMVAFNLATHEMRPWTTLLYTQSTAIVGDRLFDFAYVDGATTIPFVYYLNATQTVLVRWMVF